jgi:hypothetical protein
MDDPDYDLFSDAMDRAVSMHHSVRYGVLRNAELSGERIDGEILARRAMAAGIKAYLDELDPAVRIRFLTYALMDTAQRLGVDDHVSIRHDCHKAIAKWGCCPPRGARRGP